MREKRNYGAYAIDRREEVDLNDSVFHHCCCDELKEADKHEIIVKICEILGSDPSYLAIAERIFDSIKFDLARFVLHHEYCSKSGIRSKLLIWLDSKIYPAHARKLSNFIKQYLK